eukprot:273045-Amphidinium_carterae.1
MQKHWRHDQTKVGSNDGATAPQQWQLGAGKTAITVASIWGENCSNQCTPSSQRMQKWSHRHDLLSAATQANRRNRYIDQNTNIKHNKYLPPIKHMN